MSRAALGAVVKQDLRRQEQQHTDRITTLGGAPRRRSAAAAVAAGKWPLTSYARTLVQFEDSLPLDSVTFMSGMSAMTSTGCDDPGMSSLALTSVQFTVDAYCTAAWRMQSRSRHDDSRAIGRNAR